MGVKGEVKVGVKEGVKRGVKEDVTIVDGMVWAAIMLSWTTSVCGYLSIVIAMRKPILPKT